MEYAKKVFNINFKRSPFHFGNFSAYKAFSKVLKENTYDIIHCNTPVGGIIARIAGNKYRKKGTKIFYTAHGFHFYKGVPKKNWMIYYPIEKFMARFTDMLITICLEGMTIVEVASTVCAPYSHERDWIHVSVCCQIRCISNSSSGLHYFLFFPDIISHREAMGFLFISSSTPTRKHTALL